MRKKKKKQINIQSNETKILFGMILFVLGLSLTLAPIVNQDTIIFNKVQEIFGISSTVFGLATLYFSLYLITKGKKFKSWKQLGGLVLFAFSFGILLSIWTDPTRLDNVETISAAGGILGRELHLILFNLFGEYIEIVVVLLILIVAFSLITGTSLEQISDFLAESMDKGEKKEKFKVKDLFTKQIGDEGNNDLFKSGEVDGIDEIRIEDAQEKEDDDIETIIDTPNEQPELPINPVVQSTPTEDGDEESEFKPNEPKYQNWIFPSIDILKEPEIQAVNKEVYKKNATVIETTLRSFGIQSKVVQVSVGPTVVRYSLSLTVGIKVSKIKNLGNDLALALASQTSSVRIEAPIPGTSYIGVEIPNPMPNFVYIKDLVKKVKKEQTQYELPMILGKDISGRTVIRDLVQIPHVLVAGATGTGKSVGVNSIITGLLYTKTPDELKFIMIDPKMVELSQYNGIPYLLNPVITDMKLVSNALEWCLQEMNRRFRILKQARAKKITEYNSNMGYIAMPYIVVIIDEMADLMLTVGQDVESKIQRLAQMGRAVGIHLILATQRPTVNVITGLIKANVPGRIAYAVMSATDSRVILDQTGAETLLGNGDSLYKDNTTPKCIRIQGTLTSTADSEKVIDHVRSQGGDVEYSEELTSAMEKPASGGGGGSSDSERDEEFDDALDIILAEKKASASYLQRRLKIGYNKAARIIEQLVEAGVLSPQDPNNPSKARDILISSREQMTGTHTEDT